MANAKGEARERAKKEQNQVENFIAQRELERKQKEKA
jgi:hypothetical protein